MDPRRSRLRSPARPDRGGARYKQPSPSDGPPMLSESASPALGPCGMQAVPEDVVVVVGGGEECVVVGGGEECVVVG